LKTLTILGIPAIEFYGNGPSVVLLAGLHGEESAPPVAVQAMMPIIESWDFPVLVIPNANPAGIVQGKRKPDWLTNGSIGADDLFAAEIERSRDVALLVDLHEDEKATMPYLFGYGSREVTISLRNALYGIGVEFPKSIRKWWSKKVQAVNTFEGIIWDDEDESVDARLETKASIVVETPIAWPLAYRVAVQCFVISQVPLLYQRLAEETP
jgi:hypothetical protein